MSELKEFRTWYKGKWVIVRATRKRKAMAEFVKRDIPVLWGNIEEVEPEESKKAPVATQEPFTAYLINL